MAHELATTADGRIGMAFTGEEPWHGLGSRLLPGAPLEEWQHEAGLDWEAKLARVRYDRLIVDHDGKERPLLTDMPERQVIYRSDTGDALSVVSDRYQPVQPSQIIGFYRDLTEKYGFQLETAGMLKGGRKVWALANTKNAFQLRGSDENRLYLLLATSYDSSMATQARLTNIRVVCNNTIEMATSAGRANITIPHSTAFDADKVKLELGIGEAYEAFQQRAEAMSNRIVSRDESVRFFMEAYYNLTTTEEIKEFYSDEKRKAAADKTMDRLSDILFNAPGANLRSAQGMLWGLVQAVTFDQDHVRPARSQENRLDGAWFGGGAALKAKAWEAAERLLAA